MANQYDTNLKLQAIADAIGDAGSSGLIQALEDIADAVAGGGGGSSAGLVSDNFSETDTYDLGDYCIHNNTLYVCINAITTPGPWDLSDWQATNAGIQLSSLNSAISALNSRITAQETPITTSLTPASVTIIPTDNFRTSAYVIRAGICFVNISIQVLSTIGNVSVAVCALPNGLHTTYKPPAWSTFGAQTSNITAESLFQNGVLYIRNATNAYYVINFSYPVE